MSIITVVKNNFSGVKKTIESVIRQKTIYIEYIIIDGKSNDGTLDVINEYKNFIDLVISEKDDGLYHAMNKGISASKGEIIGILNSGDTYFDGTLKKIMSTNNKLKNEYIIHGNMKIIDDNGNSLKDLVFENKKNILKKSCSIAHPTAFIPKHIYEKIGMYDTQFKIVSDYDFFVRAILKNKYKHFHIDEMFVEFVSGGISGDTLKCIEENFEVQMKNKFKKSTALFNMYYLKTLYYTKKIVRPKSW